MEKKKFKFTQGVKYNGYAFINEYGEWNFKACERRPNMDNLKLVADVNNTKLYENSNNWKISSLLSKDNIRRAMEAGQLKELFNDIVLNMKYYFDTYIGNLQNNE